MERSSFDDRVSGLSTKDYTLVYDCLIDALEEAIKKETSEKKILKIKEEENSCKISFGGLLSVIRTAFENVANTTANKSFEEVFKINIDTAKSVSVNFENEELQEIKLGKLQAIMEDYLTDNLTDAQVEKLVSNLSKYINKNFTYINGASFNIKNQEKTTDIIEFKYIDENISSNEEYIRKDLLDVAFKGKKHKENIKNSVLNYYETELEKNEDFLEKTGDYQYEEKINELEDIVDLVKKNDFIVNDIYEFTHKQRNACLTRSSNFLYLDALINSIDIKKLNEKDKAVYLKLNRYVKRFYEFENACTNLLLNNKDRIFYVIDNKKSISILDGLRSQKIYETLPIVGKLSSILGYKKGDTISEKYGTSLKLNGVVANTSELTELTNKYIPKNLSSFRYSIQRIKALVNMTTEGNGIVQEIDYKRRNYIIESIKQAMLLKFMLLGLDDENYNPVNVLMNDIAKLSNTSTFPEACNLLKEISKDIVNKEDVVDFTLNEFARILETKVIKIRKNEIESIKKTHSYRRHLVLFKSILPDDALKSDIDKKMKEQMDTKNLRYTSLVDDLGLEQLKSHVLTSYTYDFTIESTFASFNGENPSKISSEYINDGNILNLQFIPTLHKIDKELNNSKNTKFHLTRGALTANETERLKLSMETTINDSKVTFPYIVEELNLHTNSINSFIMSVIYKTMIYVSIKSVINRIEKHKKITHINLHTQFLNGEEGPFKNSNTFIHTFYKEIDFVLGRKYTTNSQGINSEKTDNKGFNYTSSVYSNVKRKYTSKTYQGNKKIAILSITGMDVDTKKASKGDKKEDNINSKNDKISLILGELYIAEKINGEMHLEKIKNIIDSTHEDKYEQPSLILDTVKEIKDKGITDIVYLSSAPYQMKYEEEDSSTMRLFYFNESIIEMMSLNENMNIYPVYYNENNVSDSRQKDKNKYIPILINRDIKNLDKYCKGYSVGVSPFLQLYTGYSLSGKKNVYNSMVTYSTLNNMYKNISLNKTIYNGIFNDEQVNHIITDALIALHMFKYERSSLSAKIDPFSKLTGKEGIAKKSSKQYKYSSRKSYFSFACNSLAEVRYLDKTLDLIKEK